MFFFCFFFLCNCLFLFCFVMAVWEQVIGTNHRPDKKNVGCSQRCVSARLVISLSCQENVTSTRGSQPASATPRSKVALLQLSNELCRRTALILHTSTPIFALSHSLSLSLQFISFHLSSPLCFIYLSQPLSLSFYTIFKEVSGSI